MKSSKNKSPNDVLRQAREKKGWSQVELAQLVGVTEITVARWEKGRASPTKYACRKLSHVFGMSQEELGLSSQETHTNTEDAPEDAGQSTPLSSQEDHLAPSSALEIVPQIEQAEQQTSPPPKSPTDTSRRKFIGIVALVSLGVGGSLLYLQPFHQSASMKKLERRLTATRVMHILTNAHNDRISSISWSPDSSRIVSGSYDYTIKVWEASKGILIDSFHEAGGNTDVITSVAWSLDTNVIASGSWDRTVKLWEVSTGNVLAVYSQENGGHKKAVNAVAWASNNIFYLASASSDHTVKIWDTHTGKLLKTYQHDNKNIHTVAWAPSSISIAYGTDRNKVYVENIDEDQPSFIYKNQKNSITTVAWSPSDIDPRYVASGCGIYGPNEKVSVPYPDRSFLGETSIHVWNASTGKIQSRYSAHHKAITAISWSPDGKYIASGSVDATVHIWDAKTGQPIALPYKGHTSDVTAVAWSPDGKYLASGSADQSIHIWQLSS